MAEMALRFGLWGVLAFWLWIAFDPLLRASRVPAAPALSAVLSWICGRLLLAPTVQFILHVARAFGLPHHLLTMR